MSEILKEQFHYYLQNQQTFVDEYNGRVIGLKDNQVIGSFASHGDAIRQLRKAGYELGTFLLQRVSPGAEAYTVNIATPGLVSVE